MRQKTHWASGVRFGRDAADINPFQELAMATVSVMSLPQSNAEVERVFSQMSVVKTKLRKSDPKLHPVHSIWT